jgi:hypothetical protein
MTEKNSKDSIQQNVLEKIKTGEVRKVPRVYFMLRILATLFVAILLLASSALVASFIFFSLHESGEQFLLGFGFQGIVVFLKLFPWLCLAFDVALVFLLEWLLQGFKFGYRIPLLNIFIGLLVASGVLGGLLALTPLHPDLLHLSDDHQLPILAPAYEQIFDSHDAEGVCRGVVLSVGTSTFEIQHNDEDHDADDGTFTVPLPPNGAGPMLQVGQRVLVFGTPPTPGDGQNDGEPHGPFAPPCSTADHIQVLPPLNPQ